MKLSVNIFFIITLLLFAFISKGLSGGVKHPQESQSLIKFTENKQQWDKKIVYRAQLDGGMLFLENNCFTYNFYDKETLRKNHIKKEHGASQKKEQIRSHAFRMTFLNAEEKPVISTKQITPDYCNFFIGNDKNKWVGNVKNYREVNYKNLYTGIDLQILGLQNSVKYNFFVAPHANPAEIKLFYEGLDKISIEKKSLRIKTSLNEIVEQKPYAYQWIDGKKIIVLCEFVLENTTVHFSFPRGYNKNYELVIDPILVFACSTGSTADNFGMTATYDAEGNLYAGGTGFELGYPVTLGAYDESYNGIVQYARTDVVITKFDSSGTFLQYSTYLGGATGTEVVSSLIVNAQNELMLLGATGSSDFPVTANAFDSSFNGGSYLIFQENGTEYDYGTDLYVTKFNNTGTDLLASTFIGGTQNEGANNSATLVYNYGDYYRGEIQVDNTGNCYIASCTFSSDFPITAGCPQPTAGGGMDGVVFKMNPALSTLMWSSYLGGNADDGCYALTLDNLNNVYTTGGTSSTNFPVTAGSLSTTYKGGIVDGFITKIKHDGSAILKSTFAGTNYYDQSFLIQLDNDYNIYIVGQTKGTMPVSAGVYSNPNSKQFIWKLDNDLNSILVSTIFGNGNGQVNISPSAFLVDNCGNIYVCGWGGNILTSVATSNMPLSSNAFQPTTDGYNFYLFVLTPNAASLLYGTYFGGPLSREHVDGGTSRFDKKGIVYQAVCAGCGGNDDFPVTPGSWPNAGTDVNQSWNCNMGVFKFDFQTGSVNANAVVAPNDTICLGETINFNSATIYNYLWDFGDGSPISTVASPSHMYSTPGTFSVTIIASDPTACLVPDTSNLTIVVKPLPAVNLGNDTIFCQSPNLILDAGTLGNIVDWSTGETTQTISVTATGTYSVTISNGTCSATDDITIQQFPKPALGNDTVLCTLEHLTLNASVTGVSYLWSTGETTQNINVSTPGQYWVELNWGICQTSDTINVDFIFSPIINLPNSLNFCPNDTLVLDAGTNPGLTYLWSTGGQTQAIVVNAPGTYFVTASNASCSSMDTTIVFAIPPTVLDDTISLCDFQEYLLDVGISGASYLWSTGETTQAITVFSSGQYWVSADWGNCMTADTSIVDFVFSPLINLPASFNFCPNDTLILDAGPNPGASYLWSTGEDTQTITVNSPGTYFVTASTSSCSSMDTTIVIAIPPTILDDSIALCDFPDYLLDVGVSGASYLWSTGETTQAISVFSSGQYWVTADWGNCQTADTSIVDFVFSPLINLPPSLNFCPNSSILLDAGPNPGASYLWSTGENTETITINLPGTYSVTASKGSCSSMKTIDIIAVPQIALSDSINLCDTPYYTLNAGVPGISTSWSTGETSESINVFSSGQYWVMVNWGNCQTADTSIVDFVFSPLINLPPAINFCPNEALLLDAGINPGATYFWSTGEQTQAIMVDSAGTYTVTASNGSCSSMDTTEVIEVPQITLSDSISLCDTPYYTLNAGVSANSYIWSTGATTPAISVFSSGQYWVKVNWGVCQTIDTSQVSFLMYPIVNLPASAEICPHNTLTLDAGPNPGASYLWSTGEGTQTINVVSGGTYTVTVSNGECMTRDTTEVTAIPDINWKEADTLCTVDYFLLDAGISGATYLWSTGAATKTIEVSEAGTYWVIANTKECSLSDTISIDGNLGEGMLWFPNSFTPNDNGLNDYFTGSGADITYFHLIIFNRWGQVIFETDKQDRGWDGTTKGKMSELDVYIWKVNYKTKCTQEAMNTKLGHITLIR